MQQALSEANVSREAIDAIAVTEGPGWRVAGRRRELRQGSGLRLG